MIIEPNRQRNSLIFFYKKGYFVRLINYSVSAVCSMNIFNSNYANYRQLSTLKRHIYLTGTLTHLVFPVRPHLTVPLLNLSSRDHITLTLRELHWLPIPARVNFKICLLMYRVYTNSSPSYVSSLIHLSNPGELYDLHLKLILLSHDQLENLETVLSH